MAYIVGRLSVLGLTLLVAVTFNFVLPRLVPGDPVGAMLAKYQGQLDPQAVEALKVAYGLNDRRSILEQYLSYLGQLFQGNLGRSTSAFPASVSQIIASAAPWTLGLIGVTTVLAFALGSLLGLYSAWYRGGRLADVLPPVALFLSSMPYFWFALLVLYFLGFQLGWFPLGGGIAPFVGSPLSWPWWQSLLHHATLPALTILVTSAGGWLITMRNNVISILGEDYITLGRAKGLPESWLVFRYVLRNALLPSVTGFGIALGFVVAGSLLTEIVFSYPGLGYQLYQAVLSLDYPLMQGIFLMICTAVLVANFLVDLVYVILDPRVRAGRSG